MAKGRALIAAVALAVGLAGCASGTASTTDYSQGNQYTCDAVESNDDVSVGDAADGIAGLNRPETDGASPELRTLTRKWAAAFDKFQGDESDPDTQESAQAKHDQQAMNAAADAVQSWCATH